MEKMYNGIHNYNLSLFNKVVSLMIVVNSEIKEVNNVLMFEEKRG